MYNDNSKCSEGKGKKQKTTWEEENSFLLFKTILLWKFLYIHKAEKNNELSPTYHLPSTITSSLFHFSPHCPPSD